MRIQKLSIILGVFLLLVSCIKEEGPYREADIVKFTLSDDIMLTHSIINLKDNNQVIITVYDTTRIRSIKPEIELSPGATISPASGEEAQLDKEYKAVYTVTSQDGNKKQYNISIEPDKPMSYNFESWVEHGSDKRKYEMLADPLWYNGNPGVSFLYRDNEPFPTRKTEDRHNGKYGMLLETVLGNKSSFHLLDIPLYAGSAFRGVFEINLNNPVASAKFGQIHAKSSGKPIRFKGWYKYKSGAVYQTCTVQENPKKNIIEYYPEIKDEPDMYAILFKVPQGAEGKDVYLTADDLQTSDRIIAKAIVEDKSEKADWTEFDIPFTYTEEMDYTKFDYKLAIVFSSSKRGAYYEGSIGSVLHIDDVEVTSEPIE